MAASYAATPRIARSKSGADLLFDRIKLEKFRQDEKAAIRYLNSTLDISLSLDHPLDHELNDGVLLCNLVNKLKPGTIKQVGQKDLSFIKMDNITRFLQGARQLGLNNAQLFETIDLFEAKDMTAVIHTILAISQLTEKQILAASYDENNQEYNNEEEDKKRQPAAIDSRNSDDEELNTKYRHVKNIFGGYNDNSSGIGLNRDAASRKLGLGSADEHQRSRPSFSRPPKSPLRHPPRYDQVDTPPLDMSMSLSTLLPKIPKNTYRNKGKQQHDGEEQELNSTANRRLSSPAERKRQSHTFPNRNSIVATTSASKKQQQPSGSLGHKLDRQYRETVNEILSKKPHEQEDEKEEKLLLYSKDGLSTTHYQLGNCIGKGQFGSVYRALDLATGEIVAVKRLFLDDGELDQEEIMKEVTLLETLSHSNVIRYLGFIQSKHSINIILEFAENGSLMSTLKAFGAFPEKLVASFCIKILSGLEYLHSNQVVHCDLKAANILTTKTGDVKLTDFGISLNLKIKGADAGSVSGTPNWMAPEVIELKGASTKSDIWSLGCTLVELVTGKPPYADLISMSAMFRIVEDPFPPLPETISEEMKSFLMACFQKDPESRPCATQLKQHAWILQNRQRIKKTETYSHDLSSYLRNHPKPPGDEEDDDDEQDPLTNHSNLTLRNSSGVQVNTLTKHPNESQMTLFDDEDLDQDKVPLGLRDEEDYITHRFIHTSFGKVVECKVCCDLMTTQSIFCEVCSLICHEECKKSAFSCPPKVNDQQPSYDWVFSAKIYNRKSNDLIRSSIMSHRKNSLQPVQLKPQDAESIRQYAIALGLTPQEEQALHGNQALLSHTLSLQQQHKTDPGTLRHKASKSFLKDGKKKHGEECIIS